MPPALAIIGGIASVGGSVARAVGESQAAGAQAKMVQAQDRAAREAAEVSPEEIALLNRTINQENSALARQEKLISAIDPAIIEASQQALKLLRGEEAGALSPIRRERERQRSQLESRLRDQLGSGYETSSSGIEALNRFDEQTASSLQGAQQSTLGGLLGFSGQQRAAAESAAYNYSALGQRTVSDIKNRQLRAAGFAGSQFANEAAAGQSLASVGGGISSLGFGGLSFAGSGGFDKLFGSGGSSLSAGNGSGLPFSGPAASNPNFFDKNPYAA
ncbi:MAG TPA: hypothetical protein VMZ26_13360 [Pyrinomonadaceae bacterium]|nr:hypothetical protein [Pyrinomonadaceae bacterium]